eukprot:3939819-Rhodomonas_salina.1
MRVPDYRMLIHDYLGWRSSSSSSPPAQEVAPAALASDTATPPPASDSHSEAGLSERDADSEAGPSGGDCSEDAGGSSSPPGTPSQTGGGGAGEAGAWEPGAGGEEEEGGAFVATPHADSAIVQQYLRGPLLVGGAKFDLRCYMLIASSQVTCHTPFLSRCVVQFGASPFFGTHAPSPQPSATVRRAVLTCVCV